MPRTDTVLIIGGAGFIGETLTRNLAANGFRIRVADLADRRTRVAGLPGVEFEARDFTRIASNDPLFEGVDAVIHLGSTSNPGSSNRNLEIDAQRNLLPTLRILEACRARGVRTFLFASSGGTVYGNPDKVPVAEDQQTQPISGYGVCKLAIEKYMNLFSTDTLQTIALRIGNAYGIDQLGGTAVGSIANFVRKVARGEPIDVWGDGEIVRDYVYVDDIANAFRLCLTSERKIPSGAYNVGSGIGYSLNQVIREIFSVSGTSVPVNYREKRNFDVETIILDSDKLFRVTGWRPTIPLSKGIEYLWEAAREHSRTTAAG